MLTPMQSRAKPCIVPKTRAVYCTRPYFLLSLYGKPYGVNYIARYPFCLREGIRSTFTQDVVCAVHISTDLASIFCTVQAVSPPNPLSAKGVFFLVVGFVSRKRVKINKARLAGIALFPDFHLDANERGFVGDHVNKSRMRNGNKILIVFPAHLTFLLPERVLPDNDRSYPLFHQEVNNALTGGMQVVVNAPVACGRDLFHLPGDTLSIIFGKLLL